MTEQQCPECGGAGWFAEGNHADGWEQAPCAICEGTGKVAEAIPIPGSVGIDNLNEICAILSNVALSGNKLAIRLLAHIDGGPTIEERCRRAWRVRDKIRQKVAGLSEWEGKRKE